MAAAAVLVGHSQSDAHGAYRDVRKSGSISGPPNHEVHRSSTARAEIKQATARIAFVRGGAAYTADKNGRNIKVVSAPPVVDVAFAAGGTQGVWVSRVSPGGMYCDLYEAEGDAAYLLFSQVSPIADRSQGFCKLESDRKGGIYFEVDNGTAASSAVWHIAPASAFSSLGEFRMSAFTIAGWGCCAAPGGRGRLLSVIKHSYYPGGGSYEMPTLGTSGRPGSFRPLFPIPPARSAFMYGPVAISGIGTRIAYGEASGTRVSIIVAQLKNRRIASRRRIVVRLRAGMQLQQLEWFDHDTVLVSYGKSGKRIDLYRLSTRDGRPHVIVRGVDSFSVRTW